MKKSFSFIPFLLICLQGFVCDLEAAKTSKSIAPSSEAQQEIALHHMINKERKKKGLAPLVNWDVLSYYAKQHSMRMANGQVAFGHTGFEDRAESVRTHAKCRTVGENVAYCYLVKDPLATSVDLWMKSRDHYDNIVGDYEQSGIGIAYNKQGHCYITQLFSKRLP